MAKLVWRVKLVAELQAGVTTEVEVARFERDEQAGLAERECRKIGGAPASWVFSRPFSDQGWMRGLDVEVGEDRG